jgi:hypothetical protein
MPMLVLLALTAGVLPAAPEAGAASRPRPDLVIRAGDTRGSDRVLLSLTSERIAWYHRTKNIGDARPGRQSKTAILFVGPGGVAQSPSGGRLTVPRLRPGRSNTGNGVVDVNAADFEFGTYPTLICADAFHRVTESKEGNNCKRIGPTYVIPRRLTGTVRGNHPLWPGGSVKVTWTSDLTYDFSHWNFGSGEGLIVDYQFGAGVDPQVTFKVEGTDDVGCTWSGSKAYEPPVQGIRLQFGPHHRYKAEDFVSSTFHFDLTRTCNGMPATIDFYPASQLLTKWLDTHGWRKFQDPGLEALRGTYIDNVTTTKPITYSWNLAAE